MLSSLRSAALAALVAAPLMTLSLVPAIAQAKGDAAAGEGKAAACLACHGVNGNSSNPEWPSLAGQNAAYIGEQLKMFRDGKRVNVLMSPMAAALTDEDIADIGAYYAAQTPAGLEADPSYYAAGEALYRGGDRKRNIPSCKACHGPVGKGNPGSGYPSVRAQHSVYTISQLQAYASEQRYVDASGQPQRSRNGHMMVTIAKRLTEEDKRNLASYIQGMR
jgi:cytochrome c553